MAQMHEDMGKSLQPAIAILLWAHADFHTSAVELHDQFQTRLPADQKQVDATGGVISRGSVAAGMGGPTDPNPSSEKDEVNYGGFIRKASADENAHNLESGDQTADGDEPNEHEKGTLRRVGENLPASAFLIAVVELCERFTYYGCQGLFQNYISNDPDGADGPRGLGLGVKGATGLNTFFQFFCYRKCSARPSSPTTLLTRLSSYTNSRRHRCGPVPWQV